MSTGKEEVEHLSVKGLVEWVSKQVPYTVLSADQKLLEKENITGYILLQHVRNEDDLLQLGLSLCTSLVLMHLKNRVLGKKRTSDPAHVEEPFARESKRPRLLEERRDRTDAQSSVERKTGRRRPSYLSKLAGVCAARREETLVHFRDKFEDPEDAKMKLSSPNISMELPFPFIGTPPCRFNLCANDESRYHYMGREAFSKLVDAFEACMESGSLEDVWVCGPIGTGKSHLLANLVYYLTAQGRRVIYLPDCDLCYRHPVHYLQQALLFAWADKPEKADQIIDVRTLEEVGGFLRRNWEPSMAFVIDQMAASAEWPDKARIIAEVHNWLITARHGSTNVLGPSPNDVLFSNEIPYGRYCQTVLTVSSGFTRAEMDAWWDYHSDIDLGEHSRSEVEDLTGKLPLLLDRCTEGGVLNLDCQEIRNFVIESQRFEFRMESKLSGRGLQRYLAHLKACLNGNYAPDIEPEYVDHRYFYEDKNHTGHYSCGIIRDTLTKLLAERREILFSVNDSIREMSLSISNEYVAGYFLKKAILQTIMDQGIPCLELVGSMHGIIFEGHQPKFVLARSKALYVPKQFNHPVIDALILRLDKSKMTAELTPLQITTAKSHSDSEQLFLKDWSEWIRALRDYEITLTFLRIAADGKYSRTAVEAQYCGKHGVTEQLVYSSVEIPIKEVYALVWSAYQDAKNRDTLVGFSGY